MKDFKDYNDKQLARAFFDRLSSRGFKVIESKNEYGTPSEDDLKNDTYNACFDLYNADDEVFCTFDFHADGNFYRISGFTRGYYQDEVDFKKYY